MTRMQRWFGVGALALLVPGAGAVGGQPYEPMWAPEFVPASDADFMHDDDRVVGVDLDGVAKAYQVPVLAWHHIIHDTAGHLNIVPTW